MPLESRAVMVHWPEPTLVTVPLASTEATEASLVDQVTEPEAPVTSKV